MPRIETEKKIEKEKPVYSDQEVQSIGKLYDGYQIDGKMTIAQENIFYSDQGIYKIYENGEIALLDIEKYERYRDILEIYNRTYGRKKVIIDIEKLLP